MKILFAAKRLDPNRTSAGIGTCKLLVTLRDMGHEVVCLTPEKVAQSPWLEGISIRTFSEESGGGTWDWVHPRLEKLAGASAASRFLAEKANLGLATLTGYGTGFWREVAQWRSAFRREVERENPEVVFLRSAGTEFHAHVAMAQLSSLIPWIAYYHDPYPFSLYPEPYRKRSVIISGRQEAGHRNIVRRASALAFPSRRLLEWVLSGELEPDRHRALVVPHVAMPLWPPTAGAGTASWLETERFNIVHTGTLLPQRGPGSLVDGFRRFVEETEERRAQARLIFVGRVDRRHGADEDWRAALRHPNIRSVGERVNYADALQAAHFSAASVVIEAEAPASPFFPAKLADYIWLRKPVLAVTPRESSVTDILGPDYPLLVPPGDSAAVQRALTLLWGSWKNGNLDRLAPPQAVLDSISAGAARAGLQNALHVAVSGHYRTPRTETQAGEIAGTLEV